MTMKEGKLKKEKIRTKAWITGLILSFVFYLFHISACSFSSKTDEQTLDKNNKPNSVIEVDPTFKSTDESNNKVFQVSGKFVVFFMIPAKEIDILKMQSGTNTSWEYDAIFNNFKLIAAAIKPTLLKKGINSDITTIQKIEIKLDNGKKVLFDRSAADQIVGVILTDGKSTPRIEFGVFKAKDLSDAIMDFFKEKEVIFNDPLILEGDTVANSRNIRK